MAVDVRLRLSRAGWDRHRTTRVTPERHRRRRIGTSTLGDVRREANAAWGAGLYGCDPEQVLKVLARSCIGGEAAPADRDWIIDTVNLDMDG